jgi:predicted acetyltransferase
MTIELRTLQPEQWDLFFDRISRAFHNPHDPDEVRERWRRVTECERTLTAWDGDELIGTTGSYSFGITVPGGREVATAGVTMVTVQPTHRRRGVLTSMMRRQLDDVRGRGEPIAALTASEPAIYGRFGYGIATWELHGSVDTARVVLTAPEGADEVRLRLVAPPDALDSCEAVYRGLVSGRPGMLARRPGWDLAPLTDPPSTREGAGPLVCVLAEAGGSVRGYARYSITPHPGANDTVNVRDIAALDPATYAALWRFLTSIDLVAQVAFDNLPTDDPLLHLVSDPRRCALTTRDSLHLRLVDVGAALGARTYTAPVDTVLDVADAFCPWNSGRWRLTGDAEGATCERTDRPADLALDVKELGAAYLGGTTLRAMAGAGLVRELAPGALAAASTAFSTDRAPWLPHGF